MFQLAVVDEFETTFKHTQHFFYFLQCINKILVYHKHMNFFNFTAHGGLQNNVAAAQPAQSVGYATHTNNYQFNPVSYALPVQNNNNGHVGHGSIGVMPVAPAFISNVYPAWPNHGTKRCSRCGRKSKRRSRMKF